MTTHNSTDTSATAQRAVASGPLVRRYLCTGFACIPVAIRSYVDAASPEEALQLANARVKFKCGENPKGWIVPNSEDADSAFGFEFSEAEIQGQPAAPSGRVCADCGTIVHPDSAKWERSSDGKPLCDNCSYKYDLL